ncbi:MAG: hypothetical protein WA810_02085 [Maribacter sp.]
MELKSFFKTLTLIHAALVGGLVLVTVFAILQEKGFESYTDPGNVFLYIVPIVALIGYFGSQFVFRKAMAKILLDQSLKEKLNGYFAALVMKFAFLEAPALLALFAYYSSGNALPLVIALCLLAYLIVQRPTKNHSIHCLPLTRDEIRIIENS